MNDLPLDIFANYQNRPDQLVEKRAATEDIQLLEPVVLRLRGIVGGWRMCDGSMITESVAGDKRCRCISDV